MRCSGDPKKYKVQIVILYNDERNLVSAIGAGCLSLTANR